MLLSPSWIFRIVGSCARFGKVGSYGTFWGSSHNYHFFDKVLLPRIEERVRGGLIPQGSAFVYVELKGKVLLAFKVPRKLNGKFVSFSWALNRTLSAIEQGYPSAVRRRERLADQTHYHTPADIRRLWDIQAGLCYYSGVSLGESFEAAVFSVDHISPLSRGGHDGPMNLALVVPSLNTRKGDSTHARFVRVLRLRKKHLARIAEVNLRRKAAFMGVERTKATRMKRKRLKT